MEISDIQVRKTNGNGSTKGFGSFRYGELKVNFTLVSGKNGLFVSLPRHSYEKNGEPKWISDVFVENKEFFKAINDKCIAKFESGDFAESYQKPQQAPAVDSGVPF